LTVVAPDYLRQLLVPSHCGLLARDRNPVLTALGSVPQWLTLTVSAPH